MKPAQASSMPKVFLLNPTPGTIVVDDAWVEGHGAMLADLTPEDLVAFVEAGVAVVPFHLAPDALDEVTFLLTREASWAQQVTSRLAAPR